MTTLTAIARSSTATPPRRQFRLPAADEAFLDHLGLRWEAVIDANMRWIIIYALPLPLGYGRAAADVAIQILPAYPPGKLDMAYFNPPLARVDGRTIPNTQAVVALDGKNWQQWSRHRTAANPWLDGEDSFGSHFLYMQSWLVAELER
jgi:Prokaryotic E2 family E